MTSMVNLNTGETRYFVKGFIFQQSGAYAAKAVIQIQENGIWKDWKKTGAISVFEGFTLIEFNLPEGTLMRFKMSVVLGKDKTNPTIFSYKQSSGDYGYFKSTGTTLKNRLSFDKKYSSLSQFTGSITRIQF